MSDLKLCWSLKIVLAFSAGLDTVTSGASLLEFLSRQEHLCHGQGGGGSGRPARDGEGGEERKALGMLLGAQGGCKPSTFTFYCLSTGIPETG